MARILLVDDDTDFAAAAVTVLEKEKHEIVTAFNADDARSELSSSKPDLILLDVLMPGQDGFSFAQDLEKDEELSQIPVVFLTCVAEHSGQIMRALEDGRALHAVDILPKTDFPERLVDSVRKALVP